MPRPTRNRLTRRRPTRTAPRRRRTRSGFLARSYRFGRPRSHAHSSRRPAARRAPRDGGQGRDRRRPDHPADVYRIPAELRRFPDREGARLLRR